MTVCSPTAWMPLHELLTIILSSVANKTAHRQISVSCITQTDRAADKVLCLFSKDAEISYQGADFIVE
jgi:hypothetical protein